MRVNISVAAVITAIVSIYLCSSQNATAQNSPWSGAYIGGSLGYMESNIGWVYHDPAGGFADRPIKDQDDKSGILGLHAGYQFQFGQLVLGAEAGYTVNLSDNFGSSSCFNPAFNCEASVDSVATIGPRIGWAPSNQWMLDAVCEVA